MFERQNIKKIVLWLFVIMICSFGTAVLLMQTEGARLISNQKQNKIMNFISFLQSAAEANFDEEELKRHGYKDIADERILDVNNAENMYIKAISSGINIKKHDKESIRVNFHGVSKDTDYFPKLEITQEQGKILIEIKHPAKPFANISLGIARKHQLDIYLPPSYDGNLQIHTTSGNTVISELSLRQLDFKSVSGNLKASSVIVKGQTHLETTSGNVDIEGQLSDTKCKTVSGHFSVLQEYAKGSMEVSTVSGDVSIKMNKEADFDFAFNTVSGRLNNDFPIYLTSNDRRLIKGHTKSEGGNISIKTVSGNASILSK